MDAYHLIPSNEEGLHREDEECECKPEIITRLDGQKVVVHNFQDEPEKDGEIETEGSNPPVIIEDPWPR